MFFKPQPLLSLMSQGNQTLLVALGIFTLILGLAMVMSHQIWNGWPIIIFLLGFWATIKGILIIFYPEMAIQISNTVLQGNKLMIGLGFDFVLGVILIWLGFKSKT